MDFLTNINLNKNELQNAKIQNLEIEPAPASSTKGQVYFNISENVLKIFNGTSWVPVGTTYDLTSTDKSGGGVNLNLVPGNGSTDTIGIVGSGAVEVTRDNNGNITIGAEHGVDNNTVFTIGSTKNVSSGNSSTVTLTPSDGYGTTTSFNINATGKNTLTTDASGNITINGSQTTLGDLGINQSAANINAAAGSGINATKVSNYDSHLSNTSNPHSVTKTQVGLGNVDNTSDVNKPVSTATQTALNLKANKPTGTVTAGDIATLDANGHLVDSGKKVADLTYTGGDGVAISASNVVSVDNGNGLEFSTDTNKKLKAKAGTGITVDTTGIRLSDATQTSLTKADNAIPKVTGKENYIPQFASNGTLNATLTKVTTIGNPTEDNTIPTEKAVRAALNALPTPMQFKGTLGTNGTITSLSTASSSNKGYTYRVITEGTYAGQEAKVGDMFISDGATWVWVPSGDEPGGTVTNIAGQNNALITKDHEGVEGNAITSTGSITHSTQSGYKHLPSGGSSGKVLKWATEDAGQWSTLSKSDVGLGNVNNTSDANKPISTATQTALDAKEATANKKTSVTANSTSDTYFPTTKAVYTYGETKANKPTGTITANNLAGLDANGNLTDSGFKPSDFNQLYEIPITQNGSTYSTTKTPTEIYNAYVTDGKELYVTFYISYAQGKSRPVYYRFIGTGETSPIESFVFSTQYTLENGNTISDTFTLSALSEQSVTITRETHTLERISNKKTDILANKTSDTYYPTTKAVYTYGETKVDKDTDAVAGNIATFDANHNVVDSNKKVGFSGLKITANENGLDATYSQITAAISDGIEPYIVMSVPGADYNGVVFRLSYNANNRLMFEATVGTEVNSKDGLHLLEMSITSSDVVSMIDKLINNIPQTSILSTTLTTSASMQTTATITCPTGTTVLNAFVKNSSNDIVITEVDITNNIVTFTAAKDTTPNTYTCYVVGMK